MVFKSFLSKSKEVDILSEIPDGVVLIETSGKIEWTNEAASKLLNTSKTDMLKSGINEVIESGLDLARQSAESFKAVVGRSKNSLIKDFYVEITAKRTEDHYVVCFRDVTQNYKTVTNILVEHESSKKVNKDKNAFLVKLSNELKSPIHSIMGFSQAMVDGLGGDMSEKQAKYVKIINKNSSEMLYLMEKIIELSKTESNMFEYDYQIFDITNSIQTVIKLFEQQIKEKNLTLNFNSDEIAKKTVFTDENIFRTILQNILETSLNSTDIGSISITLSNPELDYVRDKVFDVPESATENSYLQVTVSDTGAGISEQDLSLLFEPYAQLDKPNKKNIVRSIALASAKNLSRYLKGSIWVDSEPMQGSTYSFIIPVEKFI